jgi:thiosulfate/3-mercaptopyruvate sulfurtransferase
MYFFSSLYFSCYFTSIMLQINSPIITATELLALYDTTNIVLVDATNAKDARTNYQEKHLKSALFVDLNAQLSSPNDNIAIGGRHPLPSPEQFTATLLSLGITKTSHVVIYDNNNGANAAARFWWLLKAIGHEKVQVLNGGMKEAEQIGFPISNTQKQVQSVMPYKFDTWLLPIATFEEVVAASQNFLENLIIDVRAADRYNGTNEPLDAVAGHIPNAINLPFSTNLDQEGLFLQPSELKTKYEQIFKGRNLENIIVHCGSGVTACHTLLSIAHAGLAIPKLYVGSWSEWSRSNQPVVTKDNL